MSRIGKMPITIPSGVKINIEDNAVTVTGPRGQFSRQLHPEMSIGQEKGSLTVRRPSESKLHRSLHGLTRTLLANMVIGVASGFEKELEIVGVGYRAEKMGEKMVLRVGHTHPVEVSPPPGIALTTEGSRIKVAGIDKEAVGQMAAKIRAIRPPDAYKGKGIRYAGEKVRLKPGKAGKVGGKK
ncbi:MAG: 50S ribosomal protein L6 [Chloroflexi bacterium]|nr:50S ribosomal protein L6 [Chloroflexota bacterium]